MNLIICPVGCPMTFKKEYDEENHWRYTDRAWRDYETLVVVYNDFEPPPNTYDHILRLSGHKWQIIKEVPRLFDTSWYNYVGCVDDDLITDIHNFNLGIHLAQEHNFPLWQLSMLEGSGIIYDCLKQNKNWSYSETNFIEMGSPFFRQDKFVEAIDFLRELNFDVGWGIDKMFCDVLNTTANVVHAASIYHPPNTIKPSYYDQREAYVEMERMILDVYPRIMREKYGKTDWVFTDSQKTLKAFSI